MATDHLPTTKLSFYLSCPHITIKTINIAKNCLERLKKEKIKIQSSTHCCLHCARIGSFTSDSDFRDHFKGQRHSFSLRASSPHEIYCVQCGDYQFCSMLDKLTGRKRQFQEPAKQEEVCIESNNQVSSSVSTSSMPKGLVNMGSTCFMNSALQVLCSYHPLTHSKHLMKHKKTCSNNSPQSSDHGNGSEKTHGTCIPCEFKTVAESLW
jgi:uncharacterized UBP type Zn finger protein